MREKSEKNKESKGDLLGSGLERGAPSKSPFDSQMPSQNGGQTTISPPAKVKLHNTKGTKILVSGIDSLYLAMNVSWLNAGLFEYLGYLKKFAIEEEKDIPVLFNNKGSDEYGFLVKPHGTNGYEWLLIGKEYSLKIGNWLEPIQRPSIMAEIRSELLWRMGFRNAVNHLIELIESQNASVNDIKPSRVDICVDVLLSEDIWSIDLIEYRTTRAGYAAPHFFNRKLTGISVGKGAVSARLYDKPLEIKQKSKKTWMYDVWPIKDVPDGMKIIRVEYQLRREALKQLSINTDRDLFSNLNNLWAYCTEKWLKFQDNPGKHHTQRKTFDWWKVIQSGFSGDFKAYPLIRHKALRLDSERLFNSALGFFLSHLAVEREIKDVDLEQPVNKDYISEAFKEKLSDRIISEDDLNKNIFRKRAKYHRLKQSQKDSSDNDFVKEEPPDVPMDVFLKELSEQPLSFVDKMEKAEKEREKEKFGSIFDK